MARKIAQHAETSVAKPMTDSEPWDLPVKSRELTVVSCPWWSSNPIIQAAEAEAEAQAGGSQTGWSIH